MCLAEKPCGRRSLFYPWSRTDLAPFSGDALANASARPKRGPFWPAVIRKHHPAPLSRMEDQSMESERSEFYFLRTKPVYPKCVKGVAIVHFHYDSKSKRLYFDHPEGSQWMASLWVHHEDCQIDLAMVLKEDGLDFIEGYCQHGESCPQVEQVKRAILKSEDFSCLREDLTHELFQGAVAGLHTVEPIQMQKTALPWDEYRSL
jgi:hypothetical protein